MPHFSTVSYNFKHRFNHGTVEYVFRWVLKAAAEEGYLDTEAIFVDGTHIKASANLKKQAKKAVPKQAKRYAKELFDEVNKDREEHGKKPFSDDSDKKPPEEKERLTYLRTVFGSLLITGPFSILLGFDGGMMALNDRLKLRSMVTAEKDDLVFIASEEAAICAMEPDARNVWAPMGGEPVIVRVKEGKY